MGKRLHDLLDQLNREVAVERLVAAQGTDLQPEGGMLRAACPFHEDAGRSLVVDPTTNTWRCESGCTQGGSAVEWVMASRKVSRRRAVEWDPA